MIVSFRRLALLAAAALPLLFPHSAKADVLEDVGTYAQDRGNDLLDIFRLRGGIANNGRGIGAKARITSLAQLGYVYFDGTYAGLDRRGVGVVDERRREGGLSLAYLSYNEMQPRHGNGFLRENTFWSEIEDRRILRNLPYHDDGRKRYLSLGGEIATPLVALDAGLYPEEALDFLVGFTTIDMYNDDEPANGDGMKLREGREAGTYEIIGLDPNTPAGPDPGAAFREKRAAFEDFKEAYPAPGPADESATPTDEEMQNPLSTVTARPGAVKVTDGGVSEEEANRAIKEADATLTPSAVVEEQR